MPFPANGDNLVLGRGSLLLDRLEGGLPTGLRFMGTAEAVARSLEDEKIEFRSSTQAGRPVIKEVTQERTIEVLATLNEYQFENLALSFMGDLVTVAQAGATGATIVFEGVKQGRYYDVGQRALSAVSVTDNGSTPVTYDLTDDYTVDAARGLIYIVPGGDIADDSEIEITFTSAAGSIRRIRGGTRTSIEARLQFISDNASGPNWRYEAWRVSITPEGELGFVTDEFGNFQLRMKVLDDSINHPNEPLDLLEQFTATP